MKSIHAVVVDTSVFADYYFLYPENPGRHERARAVLDKLSNLGLPVHEPFLFEVELRAVLVRRINPKEVLEILDIVLGHVNVMDEELIHDKASEIALLTGCRAVDAYYIAATKHVDAALVTSDRTMKENALKSDVEAYYLLNDEDYKTFMNELIS
ncbi:MAG: type II toxin-antitoxin system VapC family toxin [Desulfurococcales archaeon]|nr:type II toxin-antitoxin system VapC family toxin [Desulfurococcales archaeon]